MFAPSLDRMPTATKARRLLAVGAAAAMLAVSCSSDGATPVDEETSDTLAPPPGVSIDPTEQGAPDWVGEVVNPLDVHLGECINKYSWVENDQPIDLTTKVNCDGPHDREVFFETNFPAEAGAPYPGPQLLERFANRECYREFEAFVGVPYEVSVLDLTFTVPPEPNFVDERARYRGVVCYVLSPDGEPLTGTAFQSAE